MLYNTIPIHVEGTIADATLTTYLWGNSPEIPISKRPIIVICPGGGYSWLSDREGEAIALRFMSMGFHSAILRYSVAPDRFPAALTQLAKAVSIIREHSIQWHIDTDRVVVMGFSAGGHLAASLGVFWNHPFLSEIVGCSTEILQPNGLILAYPVITSDARYCHRDSFLKLLGEDATAQMLEMVSLENQVGPQVPRTFLWHTMEDSTVPVENSLFFVQKLLRHHIPVEFHLYEKGPHGLSLASELTQNQMGNRYQKECQSWTTLAEIWIRNL